MPETANTLIQIDSTSKLPIQSYFQHLHFFRISLKLGMDRGYFDVYRGLVCSEAALGGREGEKDECFADLVPVCID